MSSNTDEITVTLTCLTQQSNSNNTESISVSPHCTTTLDLKNFAMALFNLSDGGTIILQKDGQRLSTTNTNTLKTVGIQNGDLIVVFQQQPPSSSSVQNTTTRGGGGGGLDFSALLAATPQSSTPTPAVSRTSATTASTGGGGLTFRLPSLSSSNTSTSNTNNTSSSSAIVQWSDMTLSQAITSNPNPNNFIKVLMNTKEHANLLKELNYHHPILCSKVKSAKTNEEAVAIWKEHLQKSTLSNTLSQTMEAQTLNEMQKRLLQNPMDVQANTYMEDKIRQSNVSESYQKMMDQYPEAMGKVLMLYISMEVNGHAIQAFVDSGAEHTIMSKQRAEQCDLLRLVDERFAGTAVGVGTGKILGRIHSVEIKIANNYYLPCSVTVMDDAGLGDKNMDFLFGLDMLKRHLCSIDLKRNVLVFGSIEGLETPFLHEKDLNANKGGTKDFDVDKNNMEVEKRMMDHEQKKNEDNDKDSKPNETSK